MARHLPRDRKKKYIVVGLQPLTTSQGILGQNTQFLRFWELGDRKVTNRHLY